MATATSRPPAPIAIMPRPPHNGVWLSLPSRVLPGTAKRSAWTWGQVPLPGREKYRAKFGPVYPSLLSKKRLITNYNTFGVISFTINRPVGGLRSRWLAVGANPFYAGPGRVL